MIVEHISNINRSKNFYPPIMVRALEYLRDTDFSKLENGKYPIDGDKMFSIISEYLPEEQKCRKAETHEQYVDIQYLVAGEERIGFSRLTEKEVVAEDCLAEKDAIFYKQIEDEQDIKITEGMLIVFFPWDIHRPGCISHPGMMVRKVVLKIKVSELF